MPPSNDPQLGGDSDPNAPMIAGRGTQIAVSVRGAYQAGNLDALIGHLSAEQGAVFKQALIRQSIHLLEPFLPTDPANELGQSWGVSFARQWLAAPAHVDVKQAVIAAIGEAIDGGVRYHDYDEIFLEPIYMIDTDDLTRAANMGARVAAITESWWRFRDATLNPTHLTESAHRWQIETAWAILHDRPTPPLGDAHATE